MKLREKKSTFKVALLATGDEICNGDILNSNSQEIALRLNNQGIHVGMHAAAADNITDIENTILFLLQDHQALIITGGLGPTSDDLTRYALSKALELPLIFDEPTWDTIVTRLKQFGYTHPPESNRQQALFPQGAAIIPNPNGTALGCLIEKNQQLIFMLPGPPHECLPMIDQIVITKLIKNDFQQIVFHKSWLLFGVGEGQIAETLDAIAKPYNCITGYRICYPYIEFKIHSNNKNDFNALSQEIEEAVTPYLISLGKETATTILKKQLETLNYKIQICDHTTGGLLESLIRTPKNTARLLFTETTLFSAELPGITIAGLTELWQQEVNCKTTLIQLHYSLHGQQKTISILAPYRGERVKQYAAEWVSYQISELLKNVTI